MRKILANFRKLESSLRTQRQSCSIICLFVSFFLCFWRDNPLVGQGLLIHDVSRSHTTMQSVGLLWTSDQLIAETST